MCHRHSLALADGKTPVTLRNRLHLGDIVFDGTEVFMEMGLNLASASRALGVAVQILSFR